METVSKYEFHKLNQKLVRQLSERIADGKQFGNRLTSVNESDFKKENTIEEIQLSDDEKYDDSAASSDIKKTKPDDTNLSLLTLVTEPSSLVIDFTEVNERALSKISKKDLINYLLNDKSLSRVKTFTSKLSQMNQYSVIVTTWTYILINDIILAKIRSNDLDLFLINAVREFSERFADQSIQGIFLELIRNDQMDSFYHLFSSHSDQFKREFFKAYLETVKEIKTSHFQLVMTFFSSKAKQDLDKVAQLIRLLDKSRAKLANNEMFCSIFTLIIRNLTIEQYDLFEPIENFLKTSTSRLRNEILRMLVDRKKKLEEAVAANKLL